MITSGKLQLNTTVEEVLYTLKRTMANKGKTIFSEFRFSGSHIQTNCPFHKGGQENKPSFGVNTENGMWNCLACHEHGGSLTSLVYRVLELDTYKQAEEWLISRFDSVLLDNDEIPEMKFTLETVKTKPKKIVKFNEVSEDELAKYRYYHPYMYERKLDNNIITKYDIGYDKDYRPILQRDTNGNPIKFGELKPTITFPVRDISGKTLFIARRAVNEKYFYYPEFVEKPLYGIYELKYFNDISEVVICESMLDALHFAKIGVPAVALNGTGSELQYKQLSNLKGVFTLYLGTDNDRSGKMAKRNIRENVKGKYFKDLEYPANRKDAGECTDEELKEVIRRAKL